MAYRLASTHIRCRWIALLFLVSLAARVEATITVTLAPSPAGPQPVGTIITWTATVQDSASGTHQYRFSVGPANGSLAIVRDYQLANTFQWAFSQTEGTYQVKVLVQNISNGTSAHATDNFVVTTRRINGVDVITPHGEPAGGPV